MALSNQFNFLEREAALFKEAKTNIEDAVEFIQTTVEENTKHERKAVQDAIANLNAKIKTVVESDAIKSKEKMIDEQNELIKKSVKIAMETYKNVKKVIDENPNLSPEKKEEYRAKLYDKIISKFLTEKEKRIFEQMMRYQPLMIRM